MAVHVIERIAFTICDELELYKSGLNDWKDPQGALQRAARAVIEAMREPTDNMREAGDEAFDWNSSELYGSYYMARTDSSECWKAMIAAALEDTP
jgi:hypothetical protein